MTLYELSKKYVCFSVSLKSMFGLLQKGKIGAANHLENEMQGMISLLREIKYITEKEEKNLSSQLFNAFYHYDEYA